jgi:exo-beta-1,3-glucanase (GH17 family)
MSAATITQAQGKALRHQITALLDTARDLAAQLYVAHGGWFVPRAGQNDRASVASLADQAESHSPSLSAELRFLASRG